MKDSGRKGSSMVLERTLQQVGWLEKASGSMVKEYSGWKMPNYDVKPAYRSKHKIN